MYGGNLANTRNQTAEHSIGAGNVATLAKAWAFTPNSVNGTGKGSTQSEPVVGDGCVYFTTSIGWVYAVNADTGELVWEKRIVGTSSGQCCAGVLFAPAVNDGVVYVGASHGDRTKVDPYSGLNATFIIALDSQTGETIWQSPALATEPGGYTDSSVKFYSKFPKPTFVDPLTRKKTGQDGVVWLGISTPEEIIPATGWPMGPQPIAGGFLILDARDGHQLVRTIPVPPEEYAIRHDRGGSIWSTIAIDDDGYGYAGTAQPNPWEGTVLPSDYTNAIIKFDMARARGVDGKEIDGLGAATNPNFGKILGTFWGSLDLGQDLDFAGSPTLYKNVSGEQMVAEVQKAGRIHAGRTSSMVGKTVSSWFFPLTPTGSLMNSFCSAANDGTNVYATGSTIGVLWSLNGTTGVPNWVIQVAGTSAGDNPVQLANGVVYYSNEADGLYAFDPATGAQLWTRAMSTDGGPCKNIGPGVAIARNTIYAMCGAGPNSAVKGSTEPTGAAAQSGWLIAYRLPPPS